MPRVRCRGDFPALSEPFRVYTDLEPLEVKAVLEALTFQSRLGLPGDHILKPSRAPPLQTLVSLRIRGFRSPMQDPLHCLSPQDGAEGGPKGPRSPHSSGQQASEPRSVCVPTLPQRPTGTKSRASISLPKKRPPNTVLLPWEGAQGPSRKGGANSTALWEGLARRCDQGGLGLHTHPSGDIPPVPRAGPAGQRQRGRRLPGRAGRPGS